MKFQKLLFSVLITALCSSDFYTAANPFVKKSTAPRGSDWDSDSDDDDDDDEDSVVTRAIPTPKPAPAIPKASPTYQSALDQYGTLEEWQDFADQFPDDKYSVVTRTIPTSQPAVPAQPSRDQSGHPKVLTLAERKALLKAEQKDNAEVKQSPGITVGPRLSVKERIALSEAQAKQAAEDNKAHTWSQRIDQDAAAAKRQQELAEERKRAAMIKDTSTSHYQDPQVRVSNKPTATTALPVSRPQQLTQAEKTVRADEQTVIRDLAQLAREETQLLTKIPSQPRPETPEETAYERYERQQREALERGRAQIEHENRVWAAAGQVAPWNKEKIKHLVLVIKGIKEAVRG